MNALSSISLSLSFSLSFSFQETDRRSEALSVFSGVLEIVRFRVRVRVKLS